MRNVYKNIVLVVFLTLMIGNMYVFLSGVALGDEINHYEKEITRLHQENLDIEKKVYDAESLNYAASIAAQLDFSKHATPVYLDNLKYALNR